MAEIGVMGVATVLSLEPGISFFGSFDRGMGWLTLASGGILMLVGADVFADARGRRRALAALALGAVIPCAYALMQRSGQDPFVWAARGEPGSSLASPTFLGGYLVLVAPVAAYMTVDAARQATSVRYAGWLALLLLISAVALMTTIRGVILGIAAAAVVFGLLARPHGWTLRLVVGGVGAVVLATVALAAAAAGSTGTLGLQRFLNIARLGDSSVERLTVWRDALAIPLADPLRIAIGFGPETQIATLEKAEATVRLTQNQQWDRAHNVLLDTWLTGGLLGLAAIVAVLACAALSIWRARQEDRLLSAAFGAALVGHLVEVSFAFETVVTGTVAWVLLGLLASLSSPRLRLAGAGSDGYPSSPSSPLPIRLCRSAPRHRRLAADAALLAGIVLVPLMAAPAVADALYGRARVSNYDIGAVLEEQAAAWAPWVEELPRAAGLDWLQVANRRDDAIALAHAERNLLEAAARSPAQPLPQLRLARFYEDRGRLEAAEQACERALESGPYRAAAWDVCADISARRARADESAARRTRAEDLRRP